MINKKETRKYSTSHISLLSRIEQWKKLGGGGGGGGGVDVRTYQNNGTENLFVVIIYLIEAFKMRLLLLIAESSESPKRSNSTFKWLGKFLKDELMLYVDEEGPSSIFKIEAAQKKMFIVFNLQTALHKRFKISRKPCLNLC